MRLASDPYRCRRPRLDHERVAAALKLVTPGRRLNMTDVQMSREKYVAAARLDRRHSRVCTANDVSVMAVLRQLKGVMRNYHLQNRVVDRAQFRTYRLDLIRVN